MLARQSTALTLIVGPILDSAGAEYAGAVIGDLSISKNGGTLTAMAAAATLAYIANGMYTLVTTTANADTLGAVQVTCNKATYQMPKMERNVVPASVYDAIVANATNATGGLLAATGSITGIVGTIANTTNITDGTITTVTNLTNAPTVGDLTAAMIASVTTAATAATPIAASVAGSVGSIATGGIAAASFAANAITAASLNADAVTKIQVGLATQASVDVIDGIADAILVDTNELQTDWVNGGRLDLILDARSSQTSVDAIAVVAVKLNTMLVLDGAVYQYTANALELAPAGGGGGGTGDASEATSQEILALISSGTAVTRSPVTSAGIITDPIIIGDDYADANGRAFSWLVDPVVGFTIGDCTCWFGGDGGALGSWLVEGALAVSGDDWELSFDLLKADTEALTAGPYEWSVAVHDSAGNEVTRVRSTSKRVQLVNKYT